MTPTDTNNDTLREIVNYLAARAEKANETFTNEHLAVTTQINASKVDVITISGQKKNIRA